MRYAILGDLHANLCALEAVLSALDGKSVDRVLQVGDVVGYGAAPREVIAVLRELDAVVVKGNHDAACVGELDTRLFNPNARAAVDFTCEQLTAGEREWLEQLPLTAHTDHCALAHGTYDHPERYDYIQSVADADGSLDAMEHRVCFVGHTHVPVTVLRHTDAPDETSYTMDHIVDLAEAERALVNVGAVGQPRDEDPRACFAVWDTESGQYELTRVDYDIEREADRILRAGLPKFLADRLFLGH